jgi:hypothetical protein
MRTCHLPLSDRRRLLPLWRQVTHSPEQGRRVATQQLSLTRDAAVHELSGKAASAAAAAAAASPAPAATAGATAAAVTTDP